MKKLLVGVIAVSLLLCSVVVVNADRSIGYYDYYTGLQSGMKLYVTARPKVTADIPGVDRNTYCEEIEFGDRSYKTAIYKKINDSDDVWEGSSRVTAWTRINSGERVLLPYYGGGGSTSLTYRLGHDVGSFVQCKGSWSPDNK